MKAFRVRPHTRVSLHDFDPNDTSAFDGGKSEAVEESRTLMKQLGELQELLYAGHEHKVLIVLQGMDTSGKDGTIRHVMTECSPQGMRVKSFKRPTEPELAHDYLWRAHEAVPENGEICIFNRSHYEDVLVVRVHSDHDDKFWKKRFRQINDFEQMLAENGTLILKFFLHIDPAEQKERLQERIDDPTKHWKFQHGDLEERKLWKNYMHAYEDAINATSTEWAPWIIVPANKKWFRNWVTGRCIVKAMEKLEMEWPVIDLSGERIE